MAGHQRQTDALQGVGGHLPGGAGVPNVTITITESNNNQNAAFLGEQYSREQSDAIRGQSYSTIQAPHRTIEPDETSQWTVQDRGEEMYARDHPIDPNTANQEPRRSKLTIQDQLFRARGNLEFFPRESIHKIVRRATVIKAMKDKNPKSWTENMIYSSADQICPDGCLGTTKRFIKVFAILAVIKRIDLILDFINEDIHDAKLPLLKIHNPTNSDYESDGEDREDNNTRVADLRLKDHEDVSLKCCADFDNTEIEQFYECQWRMLSPYFAKGLKNRPLYYELEDKDILPFIEDARNQNYSNGKVVEQCQGGFSSVFKVKIHEDHHDFHDYPNSSQTSSKRHMLSDDGSFAVKELGNGSKEEFDQEVESLRHFSGGKHPNLISLLATFKQGNKYYLLFYWARADLLRFWENPDPTPSSFLTGRLDDKAVLWTLKQWLGIARGLEQIHEGYEIKKVHQKDPVFLTPGVIVPGTRRFGVHGDLKPENILLYRDPDDPESWGKLVIADFGLAWFRSRRSVTQPGMKPVKGFTPTYRPPEYDVDESFVSRSSDIWQFGCILLESIVWLFGGINMWQGFAENRKSPDLRGFNSDQFYEIKKDTGRKEGRVKQQVKKMICDLHNDPRCSDAIHAVLDLIEEKMILVENRDVTNAVEVIRTSRRASSTEIANCLQNIVKTCEDKEGYATGPHPLQREFTVDQIRDLYKSSTV